MGPFASLRSFKTGLTGRLRLQELRARNRPERALGNAVTAGLETLEARRLFSGYAITDLGTLAGGTMSDARGINATGSVAGTGNTDSVTNHAFVGTGAGLTDIGTLGGVNSHATGINSLGNVVGQADTGGGVGHAFFYNGTTAIDLGTLPGGSTSFANAISDSGWIVGGAEADFVGGPIHAFVDMGSGLVDLGNLTLNPADASVANGINSVNQIVGSSDFVGHQHAFLYANGQMTDLGVMVTNGDTVANAINDAGTIVGNGTVADGNTHAFLSINGQFTDLGVLGSDTFSSATAINSTGDIVGFSDDGADADAHAFLYSAGTMEDLNTELPSGSGWMLQKAFGINASGQITGFGTIGGQQHAFILTPNGPDTTPPTAQITAANVIDAGGTTTSFTVLYTDAGGIDTSTIGAGNVTVTGPGGLALSVTSVDTTGSGGAITATYTVAAPGGTWDATDNGVYTIQLNSQVTDASHNAVAASSATFNVNIATPPPALDPTFGGGSISANFVAEALITDINGKILLAGHQVDTATNTTQAVLERLNADGSLDKTFGTGGAIISSVGANDAFYAIQADASGRIYAAGSQNGDFMVARFKANGSVDGRFGSHGRAVTDLGGSDDAAYGLAIDANGSIVLAGGSAGTFAFARFLTSGVLDTTFGTGGRAAFAVGTGGTDVVGAVAIDSQGRIVAAGGSGANVVVARLTPAGQQDPTFDSGNAVTIIGLATRSDLGGPDRTVGLAIQSDDKILVANRTAGGDFGLARLLTDGTLDDAFATHGLATADFGGDDDADIVTLQGTGQIFVVGTTDAGGPETAVAAFNPDGSPDTTFNGSGKFTVAAGSTSASPSAQIRPQALHAGDILLKAFGGIQPDGKLVVGTPSQSPSATSTPLRRLNVPGSGTVGTFGLVAGHNKKLTFLDGDGTKITLALKGAGTGTAFYDGTSIDLVLSGTNAKSALAITGKGGDKRVRLRNVRSDGAIKSFSATNSDVTGTFFVNGGLGKAALGNLTGTIAASAAIGSLSFAGNISGAKVLSGANLGSDAALGGSNTAADSFAAGSIASIKVSGAVTDSVIGAGVDPVNGVFRDSDDTVIGGAASIIRSVSIKRTIDTQSRFIAGAFGQAKLPQKVTPATNSHFKILA